jgi:predicted DNA-binding transcriptional regulator AlpA
MLTDEDRKLPRERDSKLLRDPDVTREYLFSRAWLRKRRWLGLPPAFVRIGRMVYYERSELDAFVQSQRVEPKGGEAS